MKKLLKFHNFLAISGIIGLMDIVYMIAFIVQTSNLNKHIGLLSTSFISFSYAVLAINAIAFSYACFLYIYKTVKNGLALKELTDNISKK